MGLKFGPGDVVGVAVGLGVEGFKPGGGVGVVALGLLNEVGDAVHGGSGGDFEGVWFGIVAVMRLGL